jgi:tetratricopeptide (TPR) repeat protein
VIFTGDVMPTDQRDCSRSASVDLRKKKVLVVDDFASFRHTLKDMLRSFGITDIDDAGTGHDAIIKIAANKYNIILCDYNLGPGKDGQQLLEESKHRGFIDYSTIFMMITAENTMDMFMGALEYQPDDYLIKPFSKGVLEKKILGLIRKKETLKHIDKAIERNQLSIAIELCDDLINNRVINLSEVLKLKGECLIKRGSYQEAEGFYETVLTIGNLPWAMLGIGRIKFITGYYSEAREIFEDLITKNEHLMAAYDWLAKTHEKLGNPQDAQEILMRAVEISPKAILRQKTLGKLAYINKDLTIAKRALMQAVKQGKFSCFKSPSDYVTLAKVFVDSDVPEEGISTLKEAESEFADVPDAALPIAVVECLAYSRMNKNEEAKSAARKAARALAESDKELPRELELEGAKAFLLTGEEEKGNEIVRRVVQSHHEDQEFIGFVQNMFAELRMEDKGHEIVTAARSEIVKLNNHGVQLVREGKLEKAVEYFDKAARTLPQNKTININAAHAIILCMQKHGTNERHLEDSMKYLNRSKSIDPSNKDLLKLFYMFNELVRQG